MFGKTSKVIVIGQYAACGLLLDYHNMHKNIWFIIAATQTSFWFFFRFKSRWVAKTQVDHWPVTELLVRIQLIRTCRRISRQDMHYQLPQRTVGKWSY